MANSPVSIRLNDERRNKLAAIVEVAQRDYPTLTQADLFSKWIDEAYEKLNLTQHPAAPKQKAARKPR